MKEMKTKLLALILLLMLLSSPLAQVVYAEDTSGGDGTDGTDGDGTDGDGSGDGTGEDGDEGGSGNIDPLVYQQIKEETEARWWNLYYLYTGELGGEDDGDGDGTGGDDTPEKVRWVRELGIGISEFPVKREAAKEASALGMNVLMGAPNVLRGKSLTENLSGREAIEAGFCNLMGSDYAPMSMLHAVFSLHRSMHVPLHEAVNMVTRNPARAIGKMCEHLNPDLVSSRQMHRAMEEHIYPSIRTFLSPEDFNELKKKLEKIIRESSW